MKCNELENQIIRIDFVRFNHVWHKPTLSLTPPHTRRHADIHIQWCPLRPHVHWFAAENLWQRSKRTELRWTYIVRSPLIAKANPIWINERRPGLCVTILWSYERALHRQTHAQVCLISWKVDGWRRGVRLSSALPMQLAAFNCCITWAEGTKRFVLRIQLLWERTQKKQQIKNLSNQETNKCLQMQANSWVIENAVAVAVVAALVVVVVVAASKVVFNI